MSTNTQEKFLEVEALVTDFIQRSPQFNGDNELANQIGKAMTQLYESIVNLDRRDITKCI